MILHGLRHQKSRDQNCNVWPPSPLYLL
jgi:hypothetical protein